MIPDQWYAILDSKEVKQGRPVGVTRMGEKLVAWRDAAGQVTVVRDLCPHRGAALSIGKLVGECIECPFHGFQFDATGACRLIPANGRGAFIPQAFRIHTFPAREAHGFIYVWWGEPRESYPPVPFFETVDKEFHYLTFGDHWTVHYTRAIENQLDVVHLPFVHYNTIGRGGRTLVNGPLVRWEPDGAGGEVMNIWVYNEVDRGQTPLRPAEMPQPPRRPFLQFHMPNVWHNWISEDVRIIAAFAPIDEGNTMVYVRFHQKFMRLPVLHNIVDWFSRLSNIYILRQDKRLVLTQRPVKTDLRMGEKLIQGDGPIIAYRRKRSELMAGCPASAGSEK